MKNRLKTPSTRQSHHTKDQTSSSFQPLQQEKTTLYSKVTFMMVAHCERCLWGSLVSHEDLICQPTPSFCLINLYFFKFNFFPVFKDLLFIGPNLGLSSGVFLKPETISTGVRYSNLLTSVDLLLTLHCKTKQTYSCRRSEERREFKGRSWNAVSSSQVPWAMCSCPWWRSGIPYFMSVWNTLVQSHPSFTTI